MSTISTTFTYYIGSDLPRTQNRKTLILARDAHRDSQGDFNFCIGGTSSADLRVGKDLIRFFSLTKRSNAVIKLRKTSAGVLRVWYAIAHVPASPR